MMLSVIVGMEPTGHYWKPLASYLLKNKVNVIIVNPYHTKRAKELDDNSQTKSDKKDALTMLPLLVREGTGQKWKTIYKSKAYRRKI